MRGVAALTDDALRDRHAFWNSTLPFAGSSATSPWRVKSTADVRADAMKQDEPGAGDDRPGKAGPDRFLPDHPRSGRRPRRCERRSAVDAVSLRAEKLRPVVSRDRQPGHDDEAERHAEDGGSHGNVNAAIRQLKSAASTYHAVAGRRLRLRPGERLDCGRTGTCGCGRYLAHMVQRRPTRAVRPFCGIVS
jgi:hypothetical protein